MLSREASRRQNGLTLIEVLVALTIMTFSFVAIYRAVGGGVKSVAASSTYEQAALLIESLMAFRDSVPEAGWSDTGVSGALTWQVLSEPYGDALQKAGGPVLYRVVYQVRWKDRGLDRELSATSILPTSKPILGAAK